MEALIEDYETWTHYRSRPFILVRLMDIDTALKILTRKEREAVLLAGQYGLTTRTAGSLLGVSAMSVSRRYRSGIERMTRYLNNGGR